MVLQESRRISRILPVFLKVYATVSLARDSIGRYFAFYIERRPDSALGRKTPYQAHIDGFFTAEKTNNSTDTAIPQQGDFLEVGMGGRLAGDGETVSQSMFISTTKRLLPLRVKHMIKRRLHLDITVKPWGLDYIGKI